MADWHPATDVIVKIHKQFDYVVTEEQMKKNRAASEQTNHPNADPDWLEVNVIMIGYNYYDLEGNKKMIGMQGDWYPYYGYVTHTTGDGIIDYPEFLFE